MSDLIRNRIKDHRRVRAGDLVPHELNYRLHPSGQRAALVALYRAVGFARSLLAFEMPDGRLKLLDGHLRRDLDPDMEVDVEVLDVDEDEARTLLLSIDPIAAMAEAQEQLHNRLMELAGSVPDEVRRAWDEDVQECPARESLRARPIDVPAEYLVLVTCRDESHQVELLSRFRAEGLDCKAIL
jgi:hypothetical protein